MSLHCASFSRPTAVKLVVLTLFILVNVVLYARSKYVLMERLPQSFNISALLENNRNDISNRSRLISLTRHHSLNKTIVELHSDLQDRRASLLKKPFFREKIVNSHNFKYIIQPRVSCSDREVELVICVVISQDNHVGRSVIRNTWGSYAHDRKNNAVLVFFVGSKNVSTSGESFDSINSQIQEEASIKGDILQEDYIDSYENLSLKSVSILKWVSTFCPNTKFILKVDDDMYVNIPFLVKILRARAWNSSTPSAFIMGSMQVGAQPIRTPMSKWYTPYSMFSDDTYPKYVSGTAYAMTSEAAFLLYEASLRVPRFWLEDIYITGLCARKASVKLYNSRYFSFSKPDVSGCNFRAHVSGHRYTNTEILQIHRELYDPDLWC